MSTRTDALEFIDGWGNPIRFLRWPAGFVSDLQPLVEPAATRDPEGIMTHLIPSFETRRPTGSFR